MLCWVFFKTHLSSHRAVINFLTLLFNLNMLKICGIFNIPKRHLNTNNTQRAICKLDTDHYHYMCFLKVIHILCEFFSSNTTVKKTIINCIIWYTCNIKTIRYFLAWQEKHNFSPTFVEPHTLYCTINHTTIAIKSHTCF